MNGMKCKALYCYISALSCAVALAGCGGGGGNDTPGSSSGAGGAGVTTTGSAPAGSGSTTTASAVNAVTTGPISGFGSVIINGVRYDDSKAKIVLDDDNAARSADLRLGMMAQVESERSADDSSVSAVSIAARSHLQGPVATIGAGQLTVLGVTVTVTPSTVFDNVAGLSALAVNDRVEIYGMPDAKGGLSATRIEKSGNTEARLIGTVQNANATTFTLGGITVRYQPNALIGLSSVANGTLVRIKGNVENASIIAATAIRPASLTAPLVSGQRAELEGIITNLTDSTHFSVNGVAVIVGTGVVVQGTPALGARVEVAGTINGTTLAATKAEIKNQAEVEVEANELHGAIFDVNVTAQTFRLRNGTVTVRWDDRTAFDASLPTGGRNLTANLQIEVKGRMSGNVLLASRIKLDK